MLLPFASVRMSGINQQNKRLRSAESADFKSISRFSRFEEHSIAHHFSIHPISFHFSLFPIPPSQVLCLRVTARHSFSASVRLDIQVTSPSCVPPTQRIPLHRHRHLLLDRLHAVGSAAADFHVCLEKTLSISNPIFRHLPGDFESKFSTSGKLRVGASQQQALRTHRVKTRAEINEKRKSVSPPSPFSTQQQLPPPPFPFSLPPYAGMGRARRGWHPCVWFSLLLSEHFFPALTRGLRRQQRHQRQQQHLGGGLRRPHGRPQEVVASHDPTTLSQKPSFRSKNLIFLFNTQCYVFTYVRSALLFYSSSHMRPLPQTASNERTADDGPASPLPLDLSVL